MGAELGRAAVMGEAMAAAAGELAGVKAESAGEQLAMFTVPTRFSGVRGGHLQAALAHQRDRGRPPGAVNKSTRELREYLLARGVNPLQRMMEWALHTPTSLAAELGCTRLEAFDRLKLLWADLAPYFAAKVVAVDDHGNAVPWFQMILGGSGGSAAAQPGLPPWLAQHEQNQGVIEAAPEMSHAAMSHEATK